MRKSTRFATAVLAAGMIAASGSAYTATNTVAASSAGSGTTAISTYTTSNVQYNADSADPTLLDSVTFTLDKDARYVAMKTKADGDWYRSDDGVDPDGIGALLHSCTSVDGETWTCFVEAAETILAADNLTVVATS